MSEIQHVFYGMAGQIKGKLKTPLMVYQSADDAKEYANNYTDLNKEPKVIQFKLESAKIIDLMTPEGKNTFEEILQVENINKSDIIDYQKQFYDDVEPPIENLDTLLLKKVLKALSNKFDVVKGVSMLDNKKVPTYTILNADMLVNKEVLELDLEGNLWKSEFKK